MDIALAKRLYELVREQGKGQEPKIQPRENWWVQGESVETW